MNYYYDVMEWDRKSLRLPIFDAVVFKVIKYNYLNP